jgi:hypothetical protein
MIFGARIRSDSSGSGPRRFISASEAASDEQGNSSNYSLERLLEEPTVNITEE